MAVSEVRLINNISNDLQEVKVLLIVCHVYLHSDSLLRTPPDPPSMPSLSTLGDLMGESHARKPRHSNLRPEEPEDVHVRH
jgi:hypothetical protein